MAEVKAAEESVGEADKDAEEGSGIDAGKPSAKAKGSIVGDEREDAGLDVDAEVDQDEQEDGAEGVDCGMPMVFSPSKDGSSNEGEDEETRKLRRNLEDSIVNPRMFLVDVEAIREKLQKEDSTPTDQADGDGDDSLMGDLDRSKKREEGLLRHALP